MRQEIKMKLFIVSGDSSSSSSLITEKLSEAKKFLIEEMGGKDNIAPVMYRFVKGIKDYSEFVDFVGGLKIDIKAKKVKDCFEYGCMEGCDSIRQPLFKTEGL